MLRTVVSNLFARNKANVLPRPRLRYILRWRRILLHILVIPRQVSFIAIANIARARDAVILVRIDDQLRVDAEAAQRLVHLLAALDGNVEVTLAAEKERRRLDAIGVQERVRNLDVGVPCFRIPRRAVLVIVLNYVLIGAVEGDSERGARAAGRAFEASIARNHVIS